MDSWENAVNKKFGFSPAHLSLSHSYWVMEKWDKSIYPELAINDESLQAKLDKLHNDLAVTSKHNEGPKSQQILAGHHKFISANNILTNDGMNEMAKRSTGESSTINGFHGIGTGTTSETISDTILENEVARKAIGSTQVTNQTERYSSSFVDTDITPPQTISEAGIFTLLAGGILIMRITGTPEVLDTGDLLTLQTNVTHQNGLEL